jgi:hypothetical protein
MSHSIRHSLVVLIGVLVLFGGYVETLAKTSDSWNAEASDPNQLGWMTGFPPPSDKLIMQPESDFFSFPKLRWTVCHIRELMPTKQVSRGIGDPIPLHYAIDKNIDSVSFIPLWGGKRMTWEKSLSANYTDGILIIHEGKVVYERYFGCLDERGKHAAMSMTKSMTGLLAEILVAEGQLDENAQVASIIPELSSSAFGSTTVRQVMDMTTSLDYSEDYADPEADIWVYSTAANPLPKPDDYKGPNGYFEYLQTVQGDGVHGETFGYRTINADALGWIISRITGKDLTELLSERIWSKIGAEQDSYMTIDSKGTPFAGGGLSAGLRDLGRIGLLMLGGGEINGQRLFPKAVVENIHAGGKKAPLPRLAIGPSRAAATAACGGSSITSTAALPHVAFTGRRSTSIRRLKWLSYGSHRFPLRKTPRLIPLPYQPIRPWPSI